MQKGGPPRRPFRNRHRSRSFSPARLPSPRRPVDGEAAAPRRQRGRRPPAGSFRTLLKSSSILPPPTSIQTARAPRTARAPVSRCAPLGSGLRPTWPTPPPAGPSFTVPCGSRSPRTAAPMPPVPPPRTAGLRVPALARGTDRRPRLQARVRVDAPVGRQPAPAPRAPWRKAPAAPSMPRPPRGRAGQVPSIDLSSMAHERPVQRLSGTLAPPCARRAPPARPPPLSPLSPRTASDPACKRGGSRETLLAMGTGGAPRVHLPGLHRPADAGSPRAARGGVRQGSPTWPGRGGWGIQANSRIVVGRTKRDVRSETGMVSTIHMRCLTRLDRRP